MSHKPEIIETETYDTPAKWLRLQRIKWRDEEGKEVRKSMSWCSAGEVEGAGERRDVGCGMWDVGCSGVWKHGNGELDDPG
jgi:hypothetical protein